MPKYSSTVLIHRYFFKKSVLKKLSTKYFETTKTPTFNFFSEFRIASAINLLLFAYYSEITTNRTFRKWFLVELPIYVSKKIQINCQNQGIGVEPFKITFRFRFMFYKFYFFGFTSSPGSGQFICKGSVWVRVLKKTISG